MSYKIMVNEMVVLKHYLKKICFKGVVVSADEDILELKVLLKYFSVCNLFVDDPISVSFIQGSDIVVFPSTIEDINIRNETIKIKVSKVQKVSEQREDMRFPVSLSCELYDKNSSIKNLGYIMDISISGASVITKAEFPLEHELLIYIRELMCNVDAKIVRKLKLKQSNEYGLKILNTDLETKTEIEDYINEIKAEQSRESEDLMNKKEY